MTDEPASPYEPRSRLLPLAVLVAGLAMVGISASMLAVYSSYAAVLMVGGPLAVGAAAVLGRGAALTIKQLVFLVIACSFLGGVVNYAGYSLWPTIGLWASMATGQIAGTAAAVPAAYLAGVLVRRGAQARRDEEIAETFR